MAVSNSWKQESSELRKKRIGEANKIALLGNKCSLGRKLTPEQRAIAIKNFEGQVGDKHPRWKGDEAKYVSIHWWVRKQKKFNGLCEICNEQNKYIHLANKYHTYKRSIDDWLYLCPKCHQKYDYEHGLRHKLVGNKHPMYGKKLSVEERKVISIKTKEGMKRWKELRATP